MSLVSTMITGVKNGVNIVSNNVKNGVNIVSNNVTNTKKMLTDFANHVRTSYDNFFSEFKINSLLHKCGAKSVYGYSPLSIFRTFFTTFLKGTNFFTETKYSEFCEVSKDAGYEFLKK